MPPDPGAGGQRPSGLLAAYLLKRAGHPVTVLEANGNRAGGRVKTFRTGGHEGAEQPFADPLQYAEAGAMRLPDSHPLVMDLIDELGLTKRPFKLVAEDEQGRRTNATWLFVNGVRMRRGDYEESPQEVNRSFGVPPEYENTPASAILAGVLDPIRDRFSTKRPDGSRQDKPLPEALDGWTSVIEEFGDYSMFRFLTEYAGLDVRTVDLIGTLENLTSRLPLAFLHSFAGSALINARTQFYELEGGTAVLADALLAKARGEVVFDRRVTRIQYWHPDGHEGPRDAEDDWKRELNTIRPGLYDDYRAGNVPDDGSLLGAHPSVPGGYITEAQRVHYAANRWLSPDQPEAVHAYGGGSVCDNTNRFTFNPSHPVPGSDGGVVLASYSWADDAVRWDAFDDDARYPHALRGLQEIYGQRIEVFYTGAGKTQSWLRDSYACGEASVLLPGQHTELYPDIITPEGPLHFAGDHTSLKPAWLEGALESAIRTAWEVHRRD